MPTPIETGNGSGVQELIERIRSEGVSSARAEAERILKSAKNEAAAIRARADSEAKAMLDRARAQIATEQAAGIEALKIAARDALLELQSNVRQAFEKYVQRLVSTQTRNPEFIHSLILTLAGQAAQRYITDQDAVMFVAGTLAGQPADEAALSQPLREKIRNIVFGVEGDMLREGIELLPDAGMTGGVRVQLVNQNLEIDMSDAALSRLLLKYLLPRYRAIVQEESGD